MSEHPPDVRAARIGAVSTRAAATIGAVAVLLSGLLSLGAGILSADIASESAVRTTALQLSGETEKSKAEFLRTQQQELYSQIAADERSLVAAQEQYWHQIKYPKYTRYFPFDKLADKHINDALIKLRENGGQVEIIASTDFRKAFKELTMSQLETNISLDIVAEEHKEPIIPNSRSRLKAEHQYRDAKDKVEFTIEIKMFKAARKDMGNT